MAGKGGKSVAEQKKLDPVGYLVKRNKRSPALAQRNPKLETDLIEHDFKRKKALEMRLQHKSIATIAKEIKLSHEKTRDMINREWDLVLVGNGQKAAMIRDEENEIIDELIERWLPLAMSENLLVGESRERKNGEVYDINLTAWEASGVATDKVIKLLEQKSKINGLQTIKVDAKIEPGAGVTETFLAISSLVQSLRANQGQIIDGEFKQLEEG